MSEKLSTTEAPVDFAVVADELSVIGDGLQLLRPWQKGSRSGMPGTHDCVELSIAADESGMVIPVVHDSKAEAQGSVHAFTPGVFRGFMQDVAGGVYDISPRA